MWWWCIPTIKLTEVGVVIPNPHMNKVFVLPAARELCCGNNIRSRKEFGGSSTANPHVKYDATRVNPCMNDGFATGLSQLMKLR